MDKAHTIRNNLNGHNRDHLEITRRKLEGNQATFSTQDISPDQVDKIIGQLKNSKSSGLDNLDTYILKLTKKVIVPLYRGKGCKLDPNNYRPVAILPIVSKVLERAMFLQCFRCTLLGWKLLSRETWQLSA